MSVTTRLIHIHAKQGCLTSSCHIVLPSPTQVQWCDWDTSISDVPVSLLEPVEPQPFDVSKVTGITARVITQVMRLAGLTQEVSQV